MNPNAIKPLITVALCVLAAIVLGVTVANLDFDNLLLLCYLVLAIYLIVASGYVPLLAIGLLNPFMLPIPYIFNFPFLFLILGFCVLKFFLENAMGRHRMTRHQHCITWGFALFFGWVALRYCMRPALPNLAGFGENITGFRSYLNYGIAFALLLMLPRLLRTREDMVKLIRWLGGISLFFILFLTPFIFSKSIYAAMWLNRFGLFVTFFDNGWLRFVVLPGFGLMLVNLALIPHLVQLSIRARGLMVILGIIAVFAGGNRSSLVILFVSLLAIAFVQRRVLTFGAIALGIGFVLLAFSFIGDRVHVQSGFGFMRVMSLTSERVARQTDAADSLEWRRIRWQRAMDGIRDNPLFGRGYGGLENAWLFSDVSQIEGIRVEVDLASGGIHNGYLSAAYSLGVPSVLLFLFAVGSTMWSCGKLAFVVRATDPMLSDLHTFVFANLTGLLPAILIGADLNTPMIWFYLGLGAMLTRLPETERLAALADERESIGTALVPAH